MINLFLLSRQVFRETHYSIHNIDTDMTHLVVKINLCFTSLKVAVDLHTHTQLLTNILLPRDNLEGYCVRSSKVI